MVVMANVIPVVIMVVAGEGASTPERRAGRERGGWQRAGLSKGRQVGAVWGSPLPH